MLAVQLVLLVAMLIFTLIVRWTLKNDDDVEVKVEMEMEVEDNNLTFMASQQPLTTKPGDESESYSCAVCCAFTSTRCSRCKAVRYCSSKCQIMHWRQGHKYDCHPSSLDANANANAHPILLSPPLQCRTSSHHMHPDTTTTDSHNTMPRLSTVTDDSIHLTPESTHHNASLYNTSPTATTTTAPSIKDHSLKNLNRDPSLLPHTRNSEINISSGEYDNNSSHPFISPHLHPLQSKPLLDVDLLQSDGHQYSQRSSKHNVVKSYPNADFGYSSLQPRSRSNSRLKSSLQKVVHGFKASHHKKQRHQNSFHQTSQNHDTSENQNNKAIIQYDTFLKWYSSNEVELKPFGLINCGNSCYANAVLQCLAYTRPLTLYFLKGLHSKECWKEEWCFICEFEQLIQKAREGYTPLSPIRILSNISHLGHGKEEDAHEFLRYAVEAMQSVCVQLTGFVGPVVEEATLISMTFGGYLHSKIKCMKCHYKSEMHERMMDLTVEIDGDIRSLEQALRRFTACEMLEGNNKYHCSRCRSYEKAKKKLSVFQAPNILTIVLKRFQAGTLTKLNKLVQFPQKLDMTPFMSRSSDGYPRYSLYAVVVHLDVKSASFCGHYVCYVKNYHGEWFKIDDSVVSRVDLESVLSEEAYILLYARQSPRPIASSKDVSEDRHPDGYLQAVPARVRVRLDIPKAKNKSSDPMAMQYQSSRKGYAKDSPYLEEWVTHSVESIPRVNSSSEASSVFSYSEEGTCSTPTTKESASVDDFTDYLFSSAG